MNMPAFGYMPNAAALNWGQTAQQPMTQMAPTMAAPASLGTAGFGFMPSQAQGINWDTSALNTPGGGGESWWQTPGMVGGIAQGIGALAGAWNAHRGLGLARDQFRFQKEAYNTNLANSIQSYNTSLEDRIRGRTSDYEGKEQDVQGYLNRHSLRRQGG